jgi:hypothetical protein
MKHVYEPKDYPFAKRIEDKHYEVSPQFIAEITSGNGDAKHANLVVEYIVHNVREAYPELTIAAVDVSIPLALTLTIEGERLQESTAVEQGLVFAHDLAPTGRKMRDYNLLLKGETGLTMRAVYLHIPTLGPALKAPLPAEIDSAREAAVIK